MAFSTISRRSFVKAATIASAAAALGVSTASNLVETDEAYAESAPVRTKVHTACHGCIQICPCIAHLEDGVVVKLEGDPDAPVNKGGMCLKGMGQLQTMYSPRRILHPMKLVGPRGSNQWEAISWDEAIQLAAEQLAAAHEKYGPYSLWGAGGGGGNYASAIPAAFPFIFGATTQISPGAIQCYLPRSCMGAIMWGGDNQSMADSSVLEPFNEYSPTMELLVIWGAQPAASQTAQSGRGMADARARGVKTIVIDPNMTADASKADIWLPIRPGSDTALICAWIRYIIENELYDENFCSYWTNLPFLINPETKLPIKAEEVWPDYANPAIDPNDVFETPAYACFDKLTGTVQPFAYSAPEDAEVQPELFAEVEVPQLGVTAKTAFQLYKEQVEPWTIEAAAETCWLEADKIEAAVKLYGTTEHTGIVNGVFSDMMEIAAQVPLGLIGLDMMCGHINQPGCTLTGKGARSLSTTRKTGPTRLGAVSYQASHNRFGLGWTIGWTKTQNDKFLNGQKQQFAAQGKDPDYMQSHMAECLMDRLGTAEHKGSYYWNQSTISLVRKAVETGEPYRPRVLYEISGNKLCNVGDPIAWYNVRNELDFVVQQYSNMTSETIEMVDLFLPTTEWLEYNSGDNFVAQCNKTYLRRAATHIGETLHPEVPVGQVINRMCDILGGRDKIFDHDFMYVAGVYDDYDKKHQQWAEAFGAPSWDELLENQDQYSPVTVPPEKYWIYHQHEMTADDGLPVGFGTESRKCEPYCTTLLKMARTGFPFLYPYEHEACEDYPAMCEYKEQTENPLTDKEYPLAFTSGRVHHWHHGTMRHCAFNRELLPSPHCRMNPKTAAEHGIEHGDWVKLSSRRGSTHGKAYVTEGVAPGVIVQERFWNPECFDSSQKTITGGWQECNIACLTLETTASETFGSESYRAFQVKIEKSEKPERIWTEPEEFQPFMPTPEMYAEPQTVEEEVLK